MRSLMPIWRALPFIVLGLVLGSARADAGNKPKLSVLGLEVVNKGGGAVEKSMTVAAHDITEGLRAKITPTGLFSAATTGDHELIDEKLMHTCDDEKPTCMLEIANDLKADYLMFGSLEKGSDKGKTGYWITVKLLSVAKKGQVQSHTGFLPFPQANTENDLKIWASAAFNQLTGQDARGWLEIKVPGVETGTVFIDDVEKDTLKAGMAKIPLDENRYKLSIEVDGYKRWELGEPLTISAGKTTSKVVDNLEKLAKPKGPDTNPEITHTTTGTLSHTKSYAGWKFLAVAGIGLGIVAGGAAAYDYFVPISTYKNDQTSGAGAFDKDGQPLGHERCSEATGGPDDPAVSGERTHWRKACAARARQKIEIPVAAVTGIVGVAALVFVLTRGESNVEHASRSSKKRHDVALLPVITPDAAGGTLRISW